MSPPELKFVFSCDSVKPERLHLKNKMVGKCKIGVLIPKERSGKESDVTSKSKT